MRAPRLYPFEWAALGMAVAFLGGASLLGHAPGARAARGALSATVTALPLALLLGIGGQCAWRALTRRPVGVYWARVRDADWLALWLRLWLAASLASFAYFWLKASVPVLHTASFDAFFWRADRLVHLGASPNLMSLELLPASMVLRGLDYEYGLWLVSLVAGIGFFASAEDPAARRGAVLSCIAVWALGALLYLALPAVGPAFAFPGFYAALPQEMPLAAGSQALLWANHQRVLAGDPFDATLAVAAFPSLHVAFHVLFALWAWRTERALFPLLAGLALVTFVGSVRTGWHYAVDGYAGAALAGVAFWLALVLEGRPGAQASAPLKPRATR